MKNSVRILIGVLFGLNIALVAFIFLLLTGVVDLGKNDNVINNNNKENVVDNNVNNSESDSSIVDDQKYLSIVNEYKTAINDNNYDDNMDKYTNINNVMVDYYHKHISGVYSGSMTINYVYYDINNDGNSELIIFTNSNGGNGIIIDIYTYDGNKANRFNAGGVLGERCNVTIYDNGVIYFYGAGGASVHGLTFYKIADDGYTIKKDKDFGVEVNDGVYNIELEGVKTDFKSDEEVIKSVVKDANIVDFNKLDWIEIK